jgi:hypothetical protein
MGFEIIIGILTYLLPAIVVYFAAKYIMDSYLKNEERKRSARKLSENDQVIFPLKLQACERLILLLERITPVQAVNRAMHPGMTALELQMTLLRNIREEFEHNIAQQLYVSQDCWGSIKSAKEEVIRVINLSASEAGDGASSADMAQNLLILWSGLENDPIQTTIKQTKNEIT